MDGRAANRGMKEMNQDKRLREIFIDWLCTPRALRQPRTQIELARTLNIHVMTFSVWKQSPEFWNDFVCRLRSHVTNRIPEVAASLVAQAKRGHVAADRTFLDSFGPKAWLKVDSHGNEGTPSFDEMLRRSEDDDFPIPTWKEEELAAQEACSDNGVTAAHPAETDVASCQDDLGASKS
jgi:hypothetical protein